MKHTLLAITRPGPTRMVSLMRISLALIAWARFGQEAGLYGSHDRFSTVLAIAFFLSSTAMAVGWYARWSTLVTGLLELYLFYGQGVYWGHQHYSYHHILALATATTLLSLTPCGGTYSIDRYLDTERRRAQGEPYAEDDGDSWATYLIALQVSVIYGVASLLRFHPRWISGGRAEHIFMYLYTGSDYPDIPGFHTFLVSVTLVGNFVECFLAVALWFPRWQKTCFLMGGLFHGFIYMTMPVSTFSITMPVLYLAFVDPKRGANMIDRVAGRSWSE